MVALSGFTEMRAAEPSEFNGDFMDIFRVVEDEDGAANVRAGASLDSKITGKVSSGVVVSIMMEIHDKDEWIKIDHGGNPNGDGFMHRSRLKKLDGWKQVSAAVAKSGDRAAASYDGTEVEVVAVPFNAKKYKIVENPGGGLLVNGRQLWGTDGGIPGHSIAVTVRLGGKVIDLPASATSDLFQPNLDSLAILTSDKPNSTIVIAMSNSDGAGGYFVAWSFMKGKYAGRTVMSL